MSLSRPVVALSSAALVAGLVGTVAPPAASVEAAGAEIPGIETVGPIETAGPPVGQTWPLLPIGVAVMPRGSVLSPDSPYVSVPALAATGELPVRVVDLTSGTDLVVWSGTLLAGWARIGATLRHGGEYRVQVQQPSGAWGTVGSFSVSPRGASFGPGVSTGGMSVSVVTGHVSTGWKSPALAGPVGASSVALSWGTRSSTVVPGLPLGWQLAASPFTWARLSESATDVGAARVPGQALAVRPEGTTSASVRLAYPADSSRWVRRWVVQRKVGDGAWVTVQPLSRTRTSTGVTATVRVPATGTVWVRLGAQVEETTVWGPAARVVPDPDLATTPVGSRPLVGAGSGSLLTPGDQPAVVRLLGWDASQLTFKRNGLGVYEQAGGTVTGYVNRLSWIAPGVWEFADADGGVTRFEGGRAVSYTAKGALIGELTWDDSGRLVAVTNEIGREMRLRYGGTDTCASADWTGSGFVAPPGGMLCRLEMPDGTATDIGYVAVGSGAQVALIKSPGNVGDTYAWDAAARLVGVRPALVSRAATADPAAAAVMTRLRYGADGRVAQIVEAPASVGGATITRSIDYPSITDATLRDYVANPGAATAARAVTHVDAGVFSDLGTTYRLDPVSWRPLSVTNATGLTASTGRVDAEGDSLSSTRDMTGRQSTFTYNELGQVTRVTGPVEPGAAGIQTSTTFDTTRTAAGADVPLQGLRALVYSQPAFGGDTSVRFLATDFSRGGLSATWSGRPAEFSAQAAGIWNPSDAQDAAARAAGGWQFRVLTSAGTDVELVVGGNACPESSSACTVSGLPDGPKAVSLQVRRAGTSGWFQVLAAPVGQPLAPLPSGDVRPGFGLTSVATVNDALPGSSAGTQTRYTYANPALGTATSITQPGGLTMTMANEARATGEGAWGRLTSVTTPGGQVQSTAYWGDDVDATLPAVCGGATVRQSGQVRRITRYDGTTLETWYDIAGRMRAQVASGGGDKQTACQDFDAEGRLLSSSTFDSSDALIERTTSEESVGGDPLTSSVTVEHGPAAPVSPNTSRTATTTLDLHGREVSSTSFADLVTETEYDELGNATTVTVTPPAGSGSGPLVFAYDYRPLDSRLATVRVNGQLAATVSYSGTTGRIARIDYADGISSSFGWLPNGMLGSVVARTGAPELGTVTETRTQSATGRTQSQRVTTTGTGGFAEARGYTYDAAGRLARAVITTDNGSSPASVNLGYAYGSQDPSCPEGYGSAGKDSLRTGGTVNGATYVVCHDADGRLASTTSPLVTGGAPATATHDGLGRVLTLGGDRPLALTWGVSGKLASITETGAGGTITTTLNDYAGTLLDKSVASTAGTESVRYAGPFRLTLDGGIGGTVTGTESVQYGLPGGATVTSVPGRTAVLSLPGVTGSALVALEVPSLGSGAGAATATGIASRFGPFGEPLAAVATDTASATPAYSWRAAQRRETLPGSASITLLPERAYAPLLGEFLSPDPVLHAADNAYAYTDGDPINHSDPTGGESESNTGLLIAGSVGSFLAALGSGFLGGRFSGLVRGLAVAGVVAGAAGAGYCAYAAAKSQGADSGGAAQMAVLAAIGTAALAPFAGLVGTDKRLKVLQRREAAAQAWEAGWPGRAKAQREVDKLYGPVSMKKTMRNLDKFDQVKQGGAHWTRAEAEQMRQVKIREKAANYGMGPHTIFERQSEEISGNLSVLLEAEKGGFVESMRGSSDQSFASSMLGSGSD